MIASERRHDIDWLRVSAMFMIFLFHCARFFNSEDWHVKNSQSTLGMTVFVSFLAQWIMPTFFVVSGISSYYSLSRRTNREYVISRVKRLMIPFIFGTLVLIPPQVYFERVSHSQFAGSYIEFYPHYFDGFYAFGGNFAWMGLHLWYLLFLFIFSLMTLPLFRSEEENSLLSKLVPFFRKPGAIFVAVLPLAIMELLVSLQPDGIGRRDFGGWSLAVYLIFFIYGYLLASDPQIKLIIERNRTPALVMGVITSTLLIASRVSPSYFSFLGKNLGFILGGILRPFASWCWLVAIFGFGGRYLGFNNRVLRYANEAVLPFYILHQTVILTIGFYVVKWDAGVIPKYLIISISSFAAIIILYELLIRRLNLLRFLFGMRPKR